MYEKQTFSSGQKLTAANMNHIEAGLDAVSEMFRDRVVAESTVISSMTLTMADVTAYRQTAWPSSAVMIPDTMYQLVWQEEIYECVSAIGTVGDMSGVFIGNLALIEAGEDTGEPFLLGYSPEDAGWMLITSDTADTQTITLVKCGSNYMLPANHLPADAITTMIDEYIGEALGGTY